MVMSRKFIFGDTYRSLNLINVIYSANEMYHIGTLPMIVLISSRLT